MNSFPSALISPASPSHGAHRLCCTSLLTAALLVLGTASAHAQVITIDSQGRAVDGTQAASIDRRFAQIDPTHVQLSPQPLDTKTRLQLVRILQAEHGFAMRPFPRGHKGLTLEANGKLQPAGEPYLDMVTAEGTSAKPGDRVVITDIKFDRNKIIFMLNGGPDAKHRFLRHIQLGTGDVMNPVVPVDDTDLPSGARLTLTFKDRIPALTGAEVKSLLAPLISFDVKTPIQAFTDTLPPQLKNAILSHEVMVGMTTDMVLFALGPPDRKTREVEGQIPFEEWIYGQPPKPIQFVRINGNRVIRLEIAKVGEPPEIFTKDEVEGLMRTDGTPLAPINTRTVAMGDVTRNPDTQAAAAPPTLRKQGEALPQDKDRKSAGAMRPVEFPKQKPDDYPDASKLPRAPDQPEQGTQTSADKPGSPAAQTQPAPAQPDPAPPAPQPN